MFGRRSKPKNCKIGRPCGFGCVPKDHNCKGILKGTAKVMAQWLTKIMSGVVGLARKGKNYLDNRQRNKQRQREFLAKAEQEENKKNIAEATALIRQAWESNDRKAVNNGKAKSLRGLKVDGRLKITVTAGTHRFSGTPKKNEIHSVIYRSNPFDFDDGEPMQREVIESVRDYRSKHRDSDKSHILISKIKEFETAIVLYHVNKKYDRISPGNHGKYHYTDKDVKKIGLAAFKAMKMHIEAMPEGTILECSAYGGDGSGKYRQRIYNKIGFGEPMKGELSKRQFAIKRDGKLQPLTKSQLLIEIIESN